MLALAQLDLVLPMGAQAMVLGLAGSGKTTLLKALAGLYLPSQGEVRWDGDDLAKLGEDERRRRQAAFGMVFQTDALFDSLSVLDNVTLPLLRRNVPASDARTRAAEALASVGLAAFADVPPERLSGGMKKRAGIARAIVARPAVLLADDPLAGLDPATGRQVAELLLRVARGRTLLVAGPEPLAALPLPRWLWLSHGRLAHDGAPEPRLLEEEERPGPGASGENV